MSFGKIMYDQNIMKKQNCFIQILTFTAYIKTDDTYKDIAENAEVKFDTSNYELNRPLPKGKIKTLLD